MAVNNVGKREIGHENTEPVKDSQTTAISVLYASEYVNGILELYGYYIVSEHFLNHVFMFLVVYTFAGNGFYLYTEDDLKSKDSKQCNTSKDYTTIPDIDEPTLTDYLNEADDTPVQVIIVSLWYWW